MVVQGYAAEHAAQVVSDVEQVERLEEHEGDEGHGAGHGGHPELCLRSGRQHQHREGAGGHDCAGEQDPEQPGPGQDALAGRAGWAAHGVGADRVDAQRHRRWPVHDQVDEQDLQRGERRPAGDAGDRRDQEGDHEAERGGQLEPGELDDVVVDAAALADRADDGGEVVIGEDHRGGFLGHLGAGDAHGHADVGPTQGGRVVHPVAGHGHDVAAALQRAHDADLVLGGDPGDDADLVEPAGEVVVVRDPVQVGAGDRVAGDAEVGGDGPGGHRVVTGDHPDSDARVAALGDGLAGLGAGRVDDADERDEHDPVEQVHRVLGALDVVGGEVARPEGEHPHALLGQLGVAAGVALAGGVVQGQDLGAAEVAVGAAGQHVRCALDEAPDDVATGPVGPVVESGHELVVGVERHLRHPRPLPAKRPGVDATLLGQHQQRTLGRVADHLAVAQLAVGAQGHRQQHVLDRAGQGRAVGGPDPALGRVALTGDGEPAPGEPQLPGGHLVQGQRAGLVRADLRGAAQRLHRGEPLDDGAAPGEPGGPHGQGERHHRGQPLRDGRDGQRHGADEQLAEVLPAHQAQHEHHHDHRRGDDRQRPGQRGDLTLQRSGLRLRLVQHARDATDLGVHPGRGDHQLPGSSGNRGVHEDHGGPVTQGRVRADVRGRGLGHRLRLTGQRRLLHLQPGRGEQPPIGGHPVPRLQRHHIPDHQLRRVQVLHPPVPTHGRGGHQHVLECLQRCLRARLLNEPDGRVEQYHRRDDHRGLPLPGHGQADHSGDQQDDDQQVLELPQKRLPPWLTPRLGQPVRTIPLQSPGRLLRRQAFPRVHLQALRRLPGRRRVPERRFCGDVGHRPIVRDQARRRNPKAASLLVAPPYGSSRHPIGPDTPYRSSRANAITRNGFGAENPHDECIDRTDRGVGRGEGGRLSGTRIPSAAGAVRLPASFTCARSTGVGTVGRASVRRAAQVRRGRAPGARRARPGTRS